MDYDNGLHTIRISNEDGTVEQYSDTTPKLIKRMGESSKRYFFARVRNGNVSLGGYAPWQPW